MQRSQADVWIGRCCQRTCWKQEGQVEDDVGSKSPEMSGVEPRDQSVLLFDFRVMPSLTILDSRVEGFRSRISAAPAFPRTRQRVFSSTLRTCSRSESLWRRLGSALLGETLGRLMCSRGPLASITARSTTLRTSRTLPGQLYRWSASMLALSMDSMPLPNDSANSSANDWISRGMSSGRSRSGGILIGNTFSR